LVFIVFSKVCLAQTDAETKSVITSVIDDVPLVYTDYLGEYAVSSLTNNIDRNMGNSQNNNSIVLSEKEKAFIRKEASKLLSVKWDNDIFKKAVVLTKTKIDEIFGKDGSYWDGFYANYGKGYHSFSKPIFLRNKTICVFYQSYSCGSLCGHGSWDIYVKENGKWVSSLTIISWIS